MARSVARIDVPQAIADSIEFSGIVATYDVVIAIPTLLKRARDQIAVAR
jgi:hypothetical protein